MSGDVVARARELLDGTDESPLTIHLASADEIIGVITGLVNEVEKLRRGGKELGRIIERQCRDVLNITGLHHLIGPDGDGDWGLVWERLAEMAAAGAEVEKLRGALETIRGLASTTSFDTSVALFDILDVIERAGIEP
jgi:hypothetical protein